ncbi:YbgC/FadM family acyl-CoA thioesterase [Paracoccus sp. P2]|uniref:YbgC/FadM family acyl-CoA thioesterase n=1 Tax=Paracoccus pantotrophus TaxID=82367 RepID=A0A7H9BW06_PARPN|nr:YbgC/FadM family acyl-CoA thioesterase [Paracoccus pantotrophus]MDF3854572.1 YbgC/FadM family acyl-CoA thioesterase [Paracoccus pantotrophus]QLH15594.1 YbgC/FadM family acyl-CoA thioesterase [Paracoccus pantotrophus]RDD96291.1 thioesterase [Paracoccus pantotrophus]RNI20116.1 YbgC/FadM family acyl-CoA thioesterase [Paracoccus pantotrophus]WGR63807.1 YbgC/FadM family acyl-CoA thioesterase [Paracoccus pantotrophus]
MHLKPPPQDGHGFTQTYRIYYADTDAGGIVYHSKYLEFAERSRSELLRHVGYPLVSPNGEQFVARNADIAWQRPACLDDLIACTSSVISIRGASVRIRHVFRKENQMLVRIEIELAHINKSMKPARIPPALVEAFLPYLEPGTPG